MVANWPEKLMNSLSAERLTCQLTLHPFQPEMVVLVRRLLSAWRVIPSILAAMD